MGRTSMREAIELPAASIRINLGIFKTCDFNLYSEIGLNDLLAYTVWTLDTEKLRPTFENIVVCAHKLFPGKFSLVGYPEFPDAARVQRVILHLGPKYVGWLNGKNKTGYSLNQRGIEAVRKTTMRLQQQEGMDLMIKSPKQELQDNIAMRTAVETRLNRIKESNSYKLWAAGTTHDINNEALIWDSLQLFITADDLTKAEAYKGILMTAKSHSDVEVQQFLAWIKKKRPYLIGETPKRQRR
ncbi:MAG: hypothetical protein WC333_04490 [Dehalococcoidia bacterium]|jgi:hypothetical protein